MHYWVNWAPRLPTRGMTEAVREEIYTEVVDWLRAPRFHGNEYKDSNSPVASNKRFRTSR